MDSIRSREICHSAVFFGSIQSNAILRLRIWYTNVHNIHHPTTDSYYAPRYVSFSTRGITTAHPLHQPRHEHMRAHFIVHPWYASCTTFFQSSGLIPPSVRPSVRRAPMPYDFPSVLLQVQRPYMTVHIRKPDNDESDFVSRHANKTETGGTLTQVAHSTTRHIRTHNLLHTQLEHCRARCQTRELAIPSRHASR